MIQKIHQTDNGKRIQIGPIIGSIPEWANAVGMSSSTIYKRIDMGWPLYAAIFTPVIRIVRPPMGNIYRMRPRRGRK